DALRLELTPAASISGRITDEGGEPVAHAQVMLYRETQTGPDRIVRGRSASTAEDGTFEIERLEAGRFYIAVNAMPWYAVHSPPEPEGAMFPYRQSIDPAVDVAYPM